MNERGSNRFQLTRPAAVDFRYYDLREHVVNCSLFWFEELAGS